MGLQAQLVEAATAYCRLERIALATLADRAVQDPMLFKRMGRGATLTVRKYERFFAYFSDQGVPDPVAALAERERLEALKDPRQLSLLSAAGVPAVDNNRPEADGGPTGHTKPLSRPASGWPHGRTEDTGNEGAAAETEAGAAA